MQTDKSAEWVDL